MTSLGGWFDFQTTFLQSSNDTGRRRAETITSADRAYWPRALPAKQQFPELLKRMPFPGRGAFHKDLLRQQATSKNYFLVIWVEDFDSEKVLETAEYFVYCAVFKAHL